MPHLQLIHSHPAPRTYGEGYIAGIEEGYEQGRRDRGLELLIVGLCAGAIATAVLVVILR